MCDLFSWLRTRNQYQPGVHDLTMTQAKISQPFLIFFFFLKTGILRNNGYAVTSVLVSGQFRVWRTGHNCRIVSLAINSRMF